MTRLRLAVLGGLLVVLLGVLAAGLSGIQFRGGRLPWGEPPGAAGTPGGTVPLGDSPWLLYVVGVLFFAAVIFMLADRKSRRRTLLKLAALAATLFVLSLVGDLTRPPERTPVEEEPGLPAVLPSPTGVGSSEGGEADLPSRSPDWVAVLGAAVGAAAVAWWVLRRIRATASDEGEEMRDALGKASADLAAGLPVSDVVVRCWTRMVAISAGRAEGVNRPALTPREIASRLANLGFREEPVLALTRLFEEVRYGHKDSEPRREEALAALAAVEQAYR